MDIWLYRELVEEGYDITQRYPFRPRSKEDPLESIAERHSENCELRQNSAQYGSTGLGAPAVQNPNTAGTDNVWRPLGSASRRPPATAGETFGKSLSLILNAMSTHNTN